MYSARSLSGVDNSKRTGPQACAEFPTPRHMQSSARVLRACARGCPWFVSMYGVRADVAAVSPGSSAAGKGQLRVISACASDALRRPQASGTTTTPSFSHASAPRMMGYLAPQPQRPSGITPHVTHLWHREDTKCAQTSSVPVTVSQHHSILRVL